MRKNGNYYLFCCGVFFVMIFLFKHFLCLKIFFNLSFRVLCGFLTSFLITIFFGKLTIFYLNKFKANQIVRSITPKSYFKKNKTPTMGGILMLFSIFLAILLWTNLHDSYVWYVIYILFSYGIIGFIDDYKKIKQYNYIGLTPMSKYIIQSIFTLIPCFFLLYGNKNIIFSDFITFFIKIFGFNYYFFYILFVYFVIIGTSNAVNITDGLDGLAIIPAIFVLVSFSIVSWISSDIYLSNFFKVMYIHNVKELTIVCSIIIGSLLGFLWFNSHPAQIFLGDVGSLSLGASLGIISVLLKKELMLFVVGGFFVVEILSVIFQVMSFKIFKKRIFYMAPIHHHYELCGLNESKIVIRSWIISFILMIIGFFLFKIL